MIGSIFLTLFLGIMISLSFLRADTQGRAVDLRRASEHAFYAAESGIERAIFELRKNNAWSAGFSDESLLWNTQIIGYYTVTVAPGQPFHNAPTVWIRSIGHDSERLTPRVIFARVFVENPAAYLVFSLSDITFGSGANISGNVLGRDLIFEINYALPDVQRGIVLEDDACYLRQIVLAPADELYVQIQGEKVHSPPVTFSSVDLNYYRTLAQNNGRYIGPADGDDLTYSGTVNRANLGSDNGLIFAEGDIHISGQVDESVLFVAGGNIYIDSDVTCSGDAQIGLFAHEDAVIPASAPDTISIDAFIIADGGTFRAEGAKGSKGALELTGAIAARGRASEKTVVDLNVYTDREYTHDQALLNNRTIPFIPFITGLLSWQEHSPSDIFPPVAP